jgi:hypothetical protein
LSSPNLARSARTIEELPSDGGKTVDTLAGGLLRVFIRLNEIEDALAKLTRRVAALEGPVCVVPPEAGDAPRRGNGAGVKAR